MQQEETYVEIAKAYVLDALRRCVPNSSTLRYSRVVTGAMERNL